MAMTRRNTTGCLLKMKLDKNDLDTPAITVNINSRESIAVEALEGFDSTPREKRPKSLDLSSDGSAITTTALPGDSSADALHGSTATTSSSGLDLAGEFLCIPVLEPLRRRLSDHLRRLDESEDDNISGSTGESGSSMSSSEELEREGEVSLAHRERKAYRKRRYIVKEIFATETTYVGHLRNMVEGFFEPMELAVKNPSQSPLVHRLRGGAHLHNGDLPTWEDLKELFSTIVTIYELNDTFLSSLKAMQVHIDNSDDAQLQLGDAFLAVTDSFKFYSSFVNTYQASTDAFERIRETLIYKELCKNLEERGGRLSFNSLMVTPIQRIPRYLLLLRDLLNNTPPAHPDHAKLSVVLPKMEEVATYINTEKSKFDNLTVILNLSYLISGYTDSFIKPGRKFIKEGYLKIYDEEATKSKRRYFFLFSDILLMTRPKRGSTFFNKGTGRYQFVDSLQLLSARVHSYDKADLAHGLKISQPDGVHYILHTKEKEERVAWREAFEEAIQSVWLYTTSTNKTRSHSVPASWDKAPSRSAPSSPIDISEAAKMRFKNRSSSVDHSSLRQSGRKRSGQDGSLPGFTSLSLSTNSSSPLSSTSFSSSPLSSGASSTVSSASNPISPRSPTPAFVSSLVTSSLVQSASSALNRLTSRAWTYKDKNERKSRRRSTTLTTSDTSVPVHPSSLQSSTKCSVSSSNDDVKTRQETPKTGKQMLSRSLTATDLLEGLTFDLTAPAPSVPSPVSSPASSRSSPSATTSKKSPPSSPKKSPSPSSSPKRSPSPSSSPPVVPLLSLQSCSSTAAAARSRINPADRALGSFFA